MEDYAAVKSEGALCGKVFQALLREENKVPNGLETTPPLVSDKNSNFPWACVSINEACEEA